MRRPAVGSPHALFRACVCALLAFPLSSCTQMIDLIPTPIGGLPAGAPERPEVTPAYPAVHDMPPPRAEKPMTEKERQRLEAELAALRERHALEAQGAPAPAPAATTTTRPKLRP
jgi:hypothetical protein